MTTRCLITIGALLVAYAECQATDSEPTKIDRWLEQLDSDSYSVREQATQNLIDAGPQAFSALRKALHHRSPEVRWRSVEILTRLVRRDENRWLGQVEKTLAEAGMSATHLRPPPETPKQTDAWSFVLDGGIIFLDDITIEESVIVIDDSISTFDP